MTRPTSTHWLSLFIIAVACLVPARDAHAQNPTTRARASDVTALTVADSALHAAVASHDAERTASYYADSASMLPSGAPLVVGRDGIRRAWNSVFEIPGFRTTSHLVVADVSRAGDLAYTQGSYEATFNGASGPATEKGKFLTVWRKSADGSWKIVSDAFNADAR
ncbi:MAG: DUF4440 domain-containing protein [bacterium]